jgi:hypothetical protein
LITNNGGGGSGYDMTLEFRGDAAVGSILLRYNTIVNNAPQGNPTLYCGSPQATTIDSNIFWGNQVLYEGNLSCGAGTIVNNVVEELNGAVTPAGNYSEDPVMADSEGGDYSLEVGSSGIDNGTVTDAPGYDYLGTSRPIGNGPDVGAIESL